MKYRVKQNVFALSKLYKAGETIDIDEKQEKYFRGRIEKAEAPAKSASKKAVKSDGSPR